MKKYTKIICMAAAVCLLGAAAFCGFRIYSHYAHESEQEEVFEKIAEVVEQAQTGESETVDVLLTEEETVLAEYGELYLQNTDMVGWLSIAGTNINYPVMQTPNNPNYYLKHNFEKEYSDLGKKVGMRSYSYFDVEDGYLIACFDKNIDEEVITAIAKQKPYYFVMRDSSMANDSVATNFDQIFATYSPDTARKVL